MAHVEQVLCITRKANRDRFVTAAVVYTDHVHPPVRPKLAFIRRPMLSIGYSVFVAGEVAKVRS
jgi:hypothetical protein